jgi:hypothetical protein
MMGSSDTNSASKCLSSAPVYMNLVCLLLNSFIQWPLVTQLYVYLEWIKYWIVNHLFYIFCLQRCQAPSFMLVSFEKLVPLPGPVLKLVPPTYRFCSSWNVSVILVCLFLNCPHISLIKRIRILNYAIPFPCTCIFKKCLLY